uniref:Uncharacterized protein n=1 Tax=Arundo donax TaxID=35708 RepID=A0A0A9EE07_ARUDO
MKINISIALPEYYLLIILKGP